MLGFGGAFGPLCIVLPFLCIHRSFTAGFFRSCGSFLNPWSSLAAISVMAAVANFPSLDLGMPPFRSSMRDVVDYDEGTLVDLLEQVRTEVDCHGFVGPGDLREEEVSFREHPGVHH